MLIQSNNIFPKPTTPFCVGIAFRWKVSLTLSQCNEIWRGEQIDNCEQICSSYCKTLSKHITRNFEKWEKWKRTLSGKKPLCPPASFYNQLSVHLVRCYNKLHADYLGHEKHIWVFILNLVKNPRHTINSSLTWGGGGGGVGRKTVLMQHYLWRDSVWTQLHHDSCFVREGGFFCVCSHRPLPQEAVWERNARNYSTQGKRFRLNKVKMSKLMFWKIIRQSKVS